MVDSKFEYKIWYINNPTRSLLEQISFPTEQDLNQLGQEGWRLVSVVHDAFWFIREISQIGDLQFDEEGNLKVRIAGPKDPRLKYDVSPWKQRENWKQEGENRIVTIRGDKFLGAAVWPAGGRFVAWTDALAGELPIAETYHESIDEAKRAADARVLRNFARGA